MIRDLVGQEGRSVFLPSHVLGEVEKVSDAVANIDRGRVVLAGRIAELGRNGPSERIWLGSARASLGATRSGRTSRSRAPRKRGTAPGGPGRLTSGRDGAQREAPRKRDRCLAPRASAPDPRAALPGRDVAGRRPQVTATLAGRMIGAEILKLRERRRIVAGRSSRACRIRPASQPAAPPRSVHRCSSVRAPVQISPEEGLHDARHQVARAQLDDAVPTDTTTTVPSS